MKPLDITGDKYGRLSPLKRVKGVDYLKASMSIGGGKKIEKQMSLNKHEYEYALTTLKLWLDENRKLHNYGENHGK